MDKKTLNILNSVKNAVGCGQLSISEELLNDVYECGMQEIMMNHAVFPKEKYVQALYSIEKQYESLKANPSPAEFDEFLELTISKINELMQIYESKSIDEWIFESWKEYLNDPEMEELFDYIRDSQKIGVFNYRFTEKYNPDNIQIGHDSNGRIFYLYNNYKMYFPLSWDEKRIIFYINGILLEQDRMSPHCYTRNGFNVRENDIVVDLGVAEGNFAIDALNAGASKVYLVEGDAQWLEALKNTFANEPKVTIIESFISDKGEDGYICLDDIPEKAVDYIKMDIEGYERRALKGGQRILAESDRLILAVCSYHKRGDEKWITDFLTEKGYHTEHSSGYMFPEWEIGAIYTELPRRGVIFAKNSISRK